MRLVRRQLRRRGRPVEEVQPFDIRKIQPSFTPWKTQHGTWWGHLADKGDSKDAFLRALQALGGDILNNSINPNSYGFPPYHGATINVTQPEHRYHIFAFFDPQQYLRTVVWFEAAESYVTSTSRRPAGPLASRVAWIHTAHGEIPLAGKSSTAAPLAAILYKILGPPSAAWDLGLLALPVWGSVKGTLPFPLRITPKELLLVALGDDDFRDELADSEHPLAGTAEALQQLDDPKFEYRLPDLFGRQGRGDYDIEIDYDTGQITLQVSVKEFWEAEHGMIDNVEEHLEGDVLEKLKLLMEYADVDKWDLLSELRNGWTMPNGTEIAGIWGHKKHDPYREAPKPDEQREEADPHTDWPDEVWIFRANLLTDFGKLQTLEAEDVFSWIYDNLVDVDHFHSWFYEGFHLAYHQALEAVVDAAHAAIPQKWLDLQDARRRRKRLRDVNWDLEFRQTGRANRTKGIGHLLLRHWRKRKLKQRQHQRRLLPHRSR